MFLGILFVNTELNKQTFLCKEMLYMHYLLHVQKSKTYTQFAFCAPVVTQFIVKVKVPIWKGYHFSSGQHFLKVKV